MTKAIIVAQRRASLSAYLSNNPGYHTTEEITATIPDITARTAGQMLGAMARNKLIAPMKRKGTKKLWSWPVEPAPQVISTGKVGRSVTSAKEVELEIDGITIVVGRNPTTGRFRVVLEG